MIDAGPGRFTLLIRLLDSNVDGIVSLEEVFTNGQVAPLLTPDLKLHFRDAMSFGFGAGFARSTNRFCHIDSAARCDDRVQNRDESDVDCGGMSCWACSGGRECASDSDCFTRNCVQGICSAPSCNDGVHDRFERDVDCGWNCGKCSEGSVCLSPEDCASGVCQGELPVGGWGICAR